MDRRFFQSREFIIAAVLAMLFIMVASLAAVEFVDHTEHEFRGESHDARAFSPQLPMQHPTAASFTADALPPLTPRDPAEAPP